MVNDISFRFICHTSVARSCVSVIGLKDQLGRVSVQLPVFLTINSLKISRAQGYIIRLIKYVTLTERQTPFSILIFN